MFFFVKNQKELQKIKAIILTFFIVCRESL